MRLNAATAVYCVGVIASLGTIGTSAWAIPTNTNWQASGGNTQDYSPNGSGTALFSATSLDQGTNQSIQSIVPNAGGAGSVGDVLTFSPQTFALPAAASGPVGTLITVSWGAANRFSFTATGGNYSRAPATDAISFAFVGLFHDAGGTFDDQGATLSESWTQASLGIRPALGITFNTTPNIRIPEPASLALLGVGLLGIGLVQRRRS